MFSGVALKNSPWVICKSAGPLGVFTAPRESRTSDRAAITSDSGDDFSPVWSPDGTRIAFASDRRGVRGLYVKNASGAGDDKLLLSSVVLKDVEDWSRDGRWIVFSQSRPGNRVGLVLLNLENLKTQNFRRTRFEEDEGRLSRDGKWLAYRSNESGRFEVFIQAFPPPGGKWQISGAGGGEPQWRGDGKELFYTTMQDPPRMMAVDIADNNGAIRAGIPHSLIRCGTARRNRAKPVRAEPRRQEVPGDCAA